MSKYIDRIDTTARNTTAKYIDYIDTIARNDAAVLRVKDAEYGGSWLRRGGIGAWMMLVRKIDRLIERVERPTSIGPAQYDIFEHIAADARPEGVIDDIRDLRRYLMLVEAEMTARGVIASVATFERAAEAVADKLTRYEPVIHTEPASALDALHAPSPPAPRASPAEPPLKRELNHKEHSLLPFRDKSRYTWDGVKFQLSEGTGLEPSVARASPPLAAGPRGFDPSVDVVGNEPA